MSLSSLFKLVHKSLLFTIAFVVFSSTPALAISKEQQDLFKNGIYHYDIGAGNDLCDINGNDSFSVNRSVYVLGDSYGGGYSTELTNKLISKGYADINIDYSNGRSISGKGTSPSTSGLEAVEADKDLIASSGVVIIQLGTNPENNLKDKQEQLLNKMQKINSTAEYYWVNVGNYDDIDDSNTNKIIKENQTSFNYKLINWKSVANEDYFVTDSIHPNDNNGYVVYADLIATSLPSPQSQSTSGSSTVSNGFYNTDATKSNAERVWQFLKAPEGLALNDYQTAGVMGNIHQETGGTFGPDAKESGGSGPGRGIIQWTSGSRKTNLDNFDDKNGSSFQDALDMQLNFMKHELTTSYKKTLDLLKLSNENTFATSSISINDPIIAATLIFHGPTNKVTVPGLNIGEGYEASDDSFDFVVNTRGKEFGYEAYNKYSGKSGLFSSSSNGALNCAPNTGGVAGSGGWDLTGQNAMIAYQQDGTDPWTKRPYFDYGQTIGQVGCTAISTASIISTLSTTKIDPGALVDKFSSNPSWSNAPVQFGLKKVDLNQDFVAASEVLQKGGLILVHINPGANFADHTWSSGHFFVIRKVEAGKFYVYTLYGELDSDKNSAAYSPSDFTSGGLDKMWGYLP